MNFIKNNKTKKKWPALCLLILIFIGAGLFFHFKDYLKIENFLWLKNTWGHYLEGNYLWVLILFFIFNIFISTLPIPGNSIVSFLSGSLFGFIPGFLISSLAMSCGNLITFLVIRYFLGDWAKEKLITRYHFDSTKFEKEGVLLLLSMRIFPFVPSFLATLMMALSSMKILVFFIATYFGRLPLIMLYSWSGSEMVKITSLDDILSFKIILILFILAFLPWLLAWLLKLKKRV